jgi:signal transduction histidine kinase/CheY-like chemotaxis protein
MHRRKDGTTFPVESTSSYVAFAGEEYLFAFVRDITEQQQAQAELLRARQIESLGTLAGSIAHDFGNLLTAVLANVGLAQMRVRGSAGTSDGEPGSEHPADEPLEAAEKAVLMARDLTQQLLTFAKGGAPVRRATSLGGLIQDSVSFALSGSNVKCEVELPDDLWAAEVDQNQIGQVMSNLIINADEAMPGGGTVVVRGENVMVGARDHGAVSEGEYVKISVQDAGRGIPREEIGRVFEPYFTSKERGSGLGLTTVHSIVSKHGGHVSLESELGAGTTVEFYLPASRQAVLSERDAGERPIAGSGKVLVMDDEEVVREAAGRILEALGYEAHFARDGEEAIELYRAAREGGESFDAVIVDATVPGGMGGGEAIGKLLEADPGVRAIVSTGYSNDPLMTRFEEHGFKGAIPKPYGARELGEVLHVVLARTSE